MWARPLGRLLSQLFLRCPFPFQLLQELTQLGESLSGANCMLLGGVPRVPSSLWLGILSFCHRNGADEGLGFIISLRASQSPSRTPDKNS